MKQIEMMYNLKVIGTIFEGQDEIEVEFIPAENERKIFIEELHNLMDKFDLGILVS